MRLKPIREIPARAAKKLKQTFIREVIVEVTATIQGPGILPEKLRLDGRGRWGAYYTLRSSGRPFKHGLIRFHDKPGAEEIEEEINKIVEKWKKQHDEPEKVL